MRVAAIVLLVVVAVFFGRDVWESAGVKRDIGELQQRRLELERTISADSLLLRRLDDPEFLERYARENFLMRRDSGVGYILVD